MSAPRWWLLAFALAGCLRSTSHHCTDEQACGLTGFCEPTGFCSFADSDCPDGRRYGDGAGELAGVCVGDEPDPDAGPDADTIRDRDGDGVTDGEDNCPELANPAQDDEDGDSHGDGCDNCPHVANGTQQDLLEQAFGAQPDGVGDECDPDPTEPGDRIALFDGFNDGETPEWAETGIWTRDEGAMFVTGQTSASLLTIAVPGAGTDFVVSTTAVVGSVLGGSMGAGTGLVAGLHPQSLAGVVCAAFNEAGGGGTTMRVLNLPNGTTQNASMLSGAFIGARYQFSFAYSSRDAALPRPCFGQGLSTSATAQLDDLPKSPGPNLGLFAVRASAQFEYLVVIATAPD